MPRALPLRPALLAAFAVLLAHLLGGFLLDDFFHLERAARPFGPEGLHFAIHTDDHGIVLWPRAEPLRLEFFRPLSSLSFWLEYRMWRLVAWGYHLDNLLLHLATVFLLYLLSLRLGLARGTAAWVAAAWGVSLAVAPAAGWISGRTELLAGFFTLGAVLAYDRWLGGGSVLWLMSAFVAVTLAPLAKESGVIAPALVAIFAFWGRSSETGKPRPARPWALVLLFLPAIAYLVVRFIVLRVPPPPAPYMDPLASPRDLLWLGAKPALYAVTALLSLPLSHVSPLAELRHHPLLLVLPVTVVVFLVRPLWKAAGARRATLLLAWFIVALLPCLPILPTSLYLYVPFAGLVLLIGSARQRRPDLRWPARWLAALVVAGVFWQLVIAGFTCIAASALDRTLAEAIRIGRNEDPERLVVFDVPVWAYAFPAAIRLHDPDLHPEAWLVNFSPTVRPGPPSAIRWTGPLRLEARPARGRYFDSPFERFLLFGGSPADTASHVRSSRIRVGPDSLVEHPGTIAVEFADSSALARSAILQFHGWRLTQLARAGTPPS